MLEEMFSSKNSVWRRGRFLDAELESELRLDLFGVLVLRLSLLLLMGVVCNVVRWRCWFCCLDSLTYLSREEVDESCRVLDDKYGTTALRPPSQANSPGSR